jgi:hypothetical protein
MKNNHPWKQKKIHICQILEEHYNKTNQDFTIETKCTQYIQELHTKNNTNTISSCNSFENKQNAQTTKLENNLKVFFPPNLLLILSLNLSTCYNPCNHQGTFMVGVHKRIVSPPISLSKHYFEWPLHLLNKFFGRFFFIRYSHMTWLKWWCFYLFEWLKHVLKCFERWSRNYVSLHSFIEKDSTWLAIFVQIAPYFNHK